MAIPIPIDLTVAAAPLGWKGKLPDLITLIGQSIYGELDPTYLIGQSGGAMPTHDIGPWFYDAGGVSSGWYFWNPQIGSYSPAQQGMPVGTIVLWGGPAYTIPSNWRICDGSELSRSQFAGLFSAIGETWGAGDGESTFNLPPGAVFFINAAGFVADNLVPLTTITLPDGTTQTNGQGVGAQGGGQLSLLIQTTNLPAMMTGIRVNYPATANFIGQTGKQEVGLPNIQPQGYGSPDGFQTEPLTDAHGNNLGTNQQGVPTMPPFCSIYYIIKWQ